MASLIDNFRICKDAVLRYTPNRMPVTTLVLAYDYGAKGADGFRATQFVEAELWGPRAEKLIDSLKKGKDVYCVIDDPYVDPFVRKDGSAGGTLIGKINQIKPGKRVMAGNEQEQEA